MLMILTLDVLARIEYQCEMLTSMTKSLTCPICVALKLAINLTGNPRSTLHRDTGMGFNEDLLATCGPS